jgi:hypothetical protein
MGKSRKPKKINRKNRGNILKIKKMVEKNTELLKKLKFQLK